MIRFALRCEDEGHAFDAWFRSGEDFDAQAARGLVACPACGSSDVAKGLMRPALAASHGAPGPADAAKLAEALRRIGRDARAGADDVGPNFAEEARRIHYGEAGPRRIFGEASPLEVKGLLEEGIPALPLPPLPEDQH